ncbi:MAG: hypothetical protein L6U99_08200 [Clostridium sp.]|nr:MAG: hypothetical protein L6U99_08200 [Clostridium sp.]
MKKIIGFLAISLIKYVVFLEYFSILIEHIVEQLFIIKVLWFTIGEPFFNNKKIVKDSKEK